MKFAAFAVLAGCALASASVVRRETTADVYLKVLQCYDLDDDEGEPYFWATIDGSWAPGTSQDQETGDGKEVDDWADKWVFEDSIMSWNAVEDVWDQKIETGVYGRDSLNPDDRQGSYDVDLEKFKTNDGVPDCSVQRIPGAVYDSETFGDDLTCDLALAVCKPGQKPTSNPN